MIFLDTSFLYPLFNIEDDDHGRVREVFETFRGQRLGELLLTTPQIIFETITLIRVGHGKGRPDAQTRHSQAVHAGERLLNGKLARIYRPSEDEERAAFDYFRRYAGGWMATCSCWHPTTIAGSRRRSACRSIRSAGTSSFSQAIVGSARNKRRARIPRTI